MVLHVKCPVLKNLDLLSRFSWQSPIPNFTESRADTRGQTDMKLKDVFRDYANASKNRLITRPCLWPNKYEMSWVVTSVCIRALAMRHANPIFFCAVLSCRLWPAKLYHVFPHYFINGTLFEKKKTLLDIKLCFDFLYNFCPKYFSF